MIFNPAAVMPTKKKSNKKSLAYTARRRALSMDELRRVWNAAEEIGYRYGRVIQLLILTGQRRSEVANLNTDSCMTCWKWIWATGILDMTCRKPRH